GSMMGRAPSVRLGTTNRMARSTSGRGGDLERKPLRMAPRGAFYRYDPWGRRDLARYGLLIAETQETVARTRHLVAETHELLRRYELASTAPSHSPTLHRGGT